MGYPIVYGEKIINPGFCLHIGIWAIMNVQPVGPGLSTFGTPSFDPVITPTDTQPPEGANFLLEVLRWQRTMYMMHVKALEFNGKETTNCPQKR